jgi:TonB family protein
MTAMKHAALLAIVLAAASPAAAQDPLSAAKDLYASAAYEDALSALARIKEGDPSLEQQVDQYRAFSLFALGRTAEAEAVVEAVIRRDPLVAPDTRDASPRISAMFAQVRKRLLPDLIRDGYRNARATMDKGDLPGAVPQLTQVRKMLEEAKSSGVSTDALADLGVLVNGFLDLAKSVADKSAAEAAAAKAAAAATPPPPPAAAPSAASIAETIVNRPPPIFSSLDSDVKAPVVLRQQLPTIPYSVAKSMSEGKTSGILEVTINEKGRVEGVLMRESVNPVFDAVVLSAAKDWQYRPATKGGQPVKYLKRVGVSIASLTKK